jgi:polyisoprenoid-binding protein YceI
MPASRLTGALTLLAAVSLAASARAVARDTSYALLPAHSSLTYTFIQAGAANRGRFNTFTVRFDPTAGRLAVTVEMRSFDTGDSQRNRILAGKDFFDVARYPQARFTASRLIRTATGYRAVGALTLRGVTRTVAVPFTWRIADIGGRHVGLLTGRTTIRRLDFGIGRGQWRSTEWVGNAVTLHYPLQLVPGH